jgi:hypothetical protein
MMPIGTPRAGIISGGAEALPESVKAVFDPREDSVSSSISTIPDQYPDRMSDFSLSAGNGWSVISSGINSNQSYRSDGSSRATQDTTITTTDPFACVFVCQQQESALSNNGYFDGGQDQQFVLQDNSDSTEATRGYRAGNSNVTSTTQVDQNPRVWVVEAFSGDKIRAERDGTELFNGTATSSDLTGFTLGGFRSAVSPIQIDFGRFEILTGHTDTELSNRRDAIASDYGITI